MAEPARRALVSHFRRESPAKQLQLVSLLSVVGVLGLWEAVCRAGLVEPLFLPAPSAVFRRAVIMLHQGNFWVHILASGRRVLAGFAVAATLAVPTGIIAGTSPWVRAAVGPFLSFLRPLPSMSWIPLSLLWLGITEAQKYSIVFMGSFASTVVYTIEATRNIDPVLVRAALNLGASRVQLMRHVVLPAVSLYATRDFVEFRRYGPLVPPEDKDASLFPRRVKGRFVLMHRPIIRGEAHIWIAFSPDLKHWGDHRIVIPARPGSWDCSRVGLGPPPIETPEGWLVMYHGVRVTAAGSLYRVGLALLDLDEPWRVIRRSEEWVFGPQYSYEHVGDVPGVTFPTGAIVDGTTGELRVYYGAADTAVCLATASMDEVMEYLRECPSPE